MGGIRIRNKVFSEFDFKALTKTQINILLKMVNEKLYLVQINVPYGKYHLEDFNGNMDSLKVYRSTGNALLELCAIEEVKREIIFHKTIVYYVPTKNCFNRIRDLKLE